LFSSPYTEVYPHTLLLGLSRTVSLGLRHLMSLTLYRLSYVCLKFATLAPIPSLFVGRPKWTVERGIRIMSGHFRLAARNDQLRRP